MLFPSLGPQYYDERHKGILRKMESCYSDAITINQSFWQECDTDNRACEGDQTVWNDVYGNLPAYRRRQFNFNQIRRVINMIDGRQRQNRKSIIAVPVENADNETADQLTKVLLWATDQEGILDTISDSFRGALISGMNLLQVWMDYRQDPVSGNIRVDNCHYNSFLIDPYFKKADLSDCNFIWKRSWLTKREAISLLPDHAEEILGLPEYESGNGRDGKFQFMPQSYSYGMKNLLTYDEYYYRDFRTQKMLVDSQTGETLEWTSPDKEALEEFLRFYPQVTVVEQEIPTTRLAIVVQGKVFYDGPNPMGIDQYPFVPVFAYYNPQIPYFPYRCQSVVRSLRDPQFLYNRRKIIELDILESQINSGFIYKESALVNPADVFLQGQGRGLAIKDEANISDVQPIQSPALPPTTLEASAILKREIPDISGVNEELLGSAMDDKAGILSMLRQGAGLTTLQILFDQLDRSQKLLGKILLDLIQVNFTPGKVKKILNGEEPTAQFYNKAFGRYDARIEEGFNTTTQRQMQFAQMIQLRELGVPITNEDLLEAATLQNKKKIIENMQRHQQQAMQMQQAQAQSEMEERQARTQLAQARAQADIGLGQERLSRISENQALAEERKAEAIKDDQLAFLHYAKALKELEDIDLNQLERIIALQKLLKEEQRAIPNNELLNALR